MKAKEMRERKPEASSFEQRASREMLLPANLVPTALPSGRVRHAPVLYDVS